MKITILAWLFIFSSAMVAYGQANYTVKGNVIDSSSRQKLLNATVAILNAKDSVLYGFTRAAADGAFIINNLIKGKYLLLISYPEYADYEETFTVDSIKTKVDFGKISLTLKSKVLSEVIIKSERAAMKIKGDTTEFNAGSFKVPPNARVEDLLKQLPGIQVDKDGKITAQGKQVNKVLVDGEEFFGDDPTLVTKNIRADMVDKVQLYDKKSDQASFTGIDDGKKDKTINITLKADKKNGYFGKLEGDAGTGKYYEGQAMYNIFKAKQKFSVYGIAANDGKTGLGWGDSNKYGSSDNNVEVMDGGGIAIYSNGSGDDLDSFEGRYNGQGIPTAKSGGAHYDNKWNGDKESVNVNYKIGSINIDGSKNTLTQNNLPDGTIDNNNNQTFSNYMFRQKVDGTYQLKLDTSSNLKISGDVTAKNSTTKNDYLATSIRGNNVLLNQSDRSIDNDVDGKVYHAYAFYTKKFKKKGRTLSFLIDETYNESNAHGKLISNIKYYGSTGLLDSTQAINQYKTNNIKNSTLKTNLTYSEPLTKYFTALFNYSVGVNNSSADRKSFNQSAAGVYSLLDSTLSNNYQFNLLSNQVGAIFNYNKKKTQFNFGAKVSDVSYKQIDEYTGDVFKRSFINWNPQASYQYKISNQSTLRLEYSGTTVQPNLDQIQPVHVNTDPLNIILGNPGLVPSFRNDFNLNYYSYKVITDQNIGVYSSYSFTTNPIVSNTVTDSAGKSTFQSVNIKNKLSTNYSVYGYFGRKVKPLDINLGLNLGADGNTSYNYSNNALNMTASANYSLQLYVNKYVQKKYSLNLNFGPTYTISQSSLQSINNNGKGFTARGYFDVTLPAKFTIGSDGDYQYRAKTASFNQDFQRFVWNAWLTKSFFKEENLKLMLKGYDLLNQNRGFDRSANGSLLTQTTYTNIKRYFMLTVSWDFTHMGGAAPTTK